jgi:hypothetical protein
MIWIIGVIVLFCFIVGGFELCRYLGKKPKGVPDMANPFREERMKRDRSI